MKHNIFHKKSQYMIFHVILSSKKELLCKILQYLMKTLYIQSYLKTDGQSNLHKLADEFSRAICHPCSGFFFFSILPPLLRHYWAARGHMENGQPIGVYTRIGAWLKQLRIFFSFIQERGVAVVCHLSLANISSK